LPLTSRSSSDGVIENASPPPPPAPGAFTVGFLDDSRRNTATDPDWMGYEVVLTDGPGRGQVRQVIAVPSNGRLTVVPGWESNVAGSSYMLRKGTGWRDPAGFVRTSGNKAWATDLFEYLAIDTPQNDHFPPADPSYVGVSNGNAVPPNGVSSQVGVLPSVTYGRTTGTPGTGSFDAMPNLDDRDTIYINGIIQFVTGPASLTGEVHKITAYRVSGTGRNITVDDAFSVAPNGGDVFRIFMIPEDQATTEGLVNINTAPWPVLATLPWAEGDPNAAVVNQQIAQAIVRFRDGDPSANNVLPDGTRAPLMGNGPFRSIFDLYRVPELYLYQNSIAGSNPGRVQGDWTPDSVQFDFEEHFLILNRVSNMITTRSDSFTVYVLVQGWRGGGTPTPELVVQRRRAFTTDRSGLTSTLKDLPIQFLYND
jgi:hypothetical protein